MTKASKQVKLFPLAELATGKTRRVDFPDKAILICRVGDALYAVDDTCPHEDISLSLGVLCQHHLRCPLHGSEFDVRNGHVLNEPAESILSTHVVEVVDGWVCLQTTP